jgi:hypothetical protein
MLANEFNLEIIPPKKVVIMTKEVPPKYRITDLASSDRPRERLEQLGPEALSNAELIAILLRVGIQG